MSCMERHAINKNYAEFNFRIMQFVGIWNPYNHGIRFWFYQIYTIIVFLFVVIGYTILEIIDAINVKDDLQLFTENICLTMTHLAGIAKIINLWMRKAKIDDIVDTIELILRQNDEGEMGRFRETTISQATSHGKILTNIFAGVIWFTVVVGMAHPFWDQSYKQRKFPYRFYFPMNTTHPTTYWIAFVYMATCLTGQALIILSHDALFVVFMIHVVAQITILKRKVETLCDKKSFKNYQIKDEYPDIVETALSNSTIVVSGQRETNEWTEKLRRCIIYHQQIIRMVFELESIFGNVILLQFAASLVIIGLTGFQVVVTAQDPRLLPMVGYLCAILLELLLFCWYGNEIILQSESLGNSAYLCSWYRGDLKFCKMLRIFMARTQKPLVVTAGNFCDLSLETFAVILSRSYSYMAVLNQMNE